MHKNRIRLYALITLLCGPLLLRPALAQGEVSFRNRMDLEARYGPISVAVSDFNGDAIQDLAVATSGYGHYVYIFLGEGNGRFAAARTLSVGQSPVSITTADFDGDGYQDLAVADAATNMATILLGRGDGTFGPPQSFGVGVRPQFITAGDFNGDEIPDLAVANTGQPFGKGGTTVSVLLGRGDGTFAAAPPVTAGSRPFSIAVGDFNGDGISDLAVANLDSGEVSILLGSGAGRFESARQFWVGKGASSIAVGDFNGDNVQDLVVANGTGETERPGSTVAVILGNGDGTFGPARHFEAGVMPSSVTVADFNGDRIPDLAVVSWGWVDGTDSSQVTILLGKGDGTFQSGRNFEVGRGPRSVVVGDFNGDDRPDLAVANWDHWGCRLLHWVDFSGLCLLGTTVSILLNDTSWPTNAAPSRSR